MFEVTGFELGYWKGLTLNVGLCADWKEVGLKLKFVPRPATGMLLETIEAQD